MKEIVKHYQTLLTCEQFLLTGSKALSLMGLVDTNNVGDIDIILVNPTDEAKSILARLQKDNPAKTKPISGGKVAYIFMHEGIKVDVFIEDKMVRTVLNADGILLNPADRIVQAKKKSDRLKDWIQLRKIANKIVSAGEFESYLDSH